MADTSVGVTCQSVCLCLCEIVRLCSRYVSAMEKLCLRCEESVNVIKKNHLYVEVSSSAARGVTCRGFAFVSCVSNTHHATVFPHPPQPPSCLSSWTLLEPLNCSVSFFPCEKALFISCLFVLVFFFPSLPWKVCRPRRRGGRGVTYRPPDWPVWAALSCALQTTCTHCVCSGYLRRVKHY